MLELVTQETLAMAWFTPSGQPRKLPQQMLPQPVLVALRRFFNWKIAIGILIVAFILTLMMECLLGILLLKIQ